MWLDLRLNWWLKRIRLPLRLKDRYRIINCFAESLKCRDMPLGSDAKVAGQAPSQGPCRENDTSGSDLGGRCLYICGGNRDSFTIFQWIHSSQNCNRLFRIWSGSLGNFGSQSSHDGTGPHTYTIEQDGNSPLDVSASIEKSDGNSSTLTVSIVSMDGTVLATGNTDEAYGIVNISWSSS